jgi:hypothetical protein
MSARTTKPGHERCFRQRHEHVLIWLMQSNVTALERAVALAKSGTCRTFANIRERLKQEGYRAEQITGPELLKQLRAVMAQNLPS